MEINDVPEWFEGLKWFIAAFLLACAFVGPQILGPIMNRLKASASAAVTPPHIDKNQLAVIGGTLADKDAVFALSVSIGRLCDILEKKYKLEEEENEEAQLERKIKQAMKELAKQDKD